MPVVGNVHQTALQYFRYAHLLAKYIASSVVTPAVTCQVLRAAVKIWMVRHSITYNVVEAKGVVEAEEVEANVAFRSFKVEAARVKFITATWSLCYQVTAKLGGPPTLVLPCPHTVCIS